MIRIDKELRMYKANINQLADIINLYEERMQWFKERAIQQWERYVSNHPKNEFLEALNNNRLFIIMKKDEIVGAVELKEYDDLWEDNQIGLYIKKLVTKSSYRGIGKYIISTAKRVAEKRNLQFVRLECRQSNPILNEIYEGHGFELVRTVSRPEVAQPDIVYSYNLREYRLK